jgi:hypothetical protein
MKSKKILGRLEDNPTIRSFLELLVVPLNCVSRDTEINYFILSLHDYLRKESPHMNWTTIIEVKNVVCPDESW